MGEPASSGLRPYNRCVSSDQCTWLVTRSHSQLPRRAICWACASWDWLLRKLFLGLPALVVFPGQIRRPFGDRLLDAILQGLQPGLAFGDEEHFAEAFADGNDEERDLEHDPAGVLERPENRWRHARHTRIAARKSPAHRWSTMTTSEAEISTCQSR